MPLSESLLLYLLNWLSKNVSKQSAGEGGREWGIAPKRSGQINERAAPCIHVRARHKTQLV